jgi:succinate dehydrogenase flavin-adding protein (antitoxin of CptAB toxin-antitoxin module)
LAGFYPVGDLDRIRWHCRRGLLELDLVLARFLDRHFAGLSPSEEEAFKALLEYPDNDLWDLVAGRTEAGPGDQATVLALLRED